MIMIDKDNIHFDWLITKLIKIKFGGKVKNLIPLQDIIYFKAGSSGAEIVTTSKMYFIYKSLHEIEGKLPHAFRSN